jgi:hypothetical protein
MEPVQLTAGKLALVELGEHLLAHLKLLGYSEVG